MENNKTNLPNEPQKPQKKKRSFWRYIILMWICFFLLWGGVALFFVGVSGGFFGKLPDWSELENPESQLATEVFYADGSLMGKYYIQDRSRVSYEDISPAVVNTLIAVEDKRYHSHTGIDLYGLSTAVYRFVTSGKTAGASTITQQLAKNLFHERSSSFIKRVLQKTKEWVIATRLEKNYTKDEIITMYLNTVHFGGPVYGIKSAAKTFFSKTPKELNYNEAAFLVGMLKASTAYNPARNPDRAKGRRNVVLTLLEQQDYISAAKKDSLKNTDYDKSLFNKSTHRTGNAQYFREYLREYVKNWAKENKKLDGDNYDIHRDGLKIYTTIDPTMQVYAEQALAEHLPTLQADFDKHWNKEDPWENMPKDYTLTAEEFIERNIKRSERYRVMKKNGKSMDEVKAAFEVPTKMSIFTWEGEKDTVITPLDSLKHYKRLLRSGFMAMNPQTGHVKAWVGGIDFTYLQYDNVRPSSKNQVGSTFKPFIYTIAIQNGWSPCAKAPNSPVTIPKGKHGATNDWTPRGSTSDKLDYKQIRLKTALAHSLNWVTAYLMNEIGPRPVSEMAKRMGIESNIPVVPSIALGAADISLYEMVGAYSTFANKGTHTEPLFITRIEDKNGQLIQDFVPQRNEALGEQHAYIMLNLMKGVKDEGTGRRLMSKYGFTTEMDVAGKTGTTNNNSDGWFMGITPNLIAGVWTGGDEKAIRFRTTALGQGANMALPIYAKFMNKVYDDGTLGVTREDKFEEPEGRMSVELDCNRYDNYNLSADDFDNPEDTFIDSLKIQEKLKLDQEEDEW